jgi:hypothetical protein
MNAFPFMNNNIQKEYIKILPVDKFNESLQRTERKYNLSR